MADPGANPLLRFLARKRVPLGFVTAVATAVLAHPTQTSWRVGLVIAIVGEFVRIWAAGHLEKGREVTRSGPYRWSAHPLYVGSSVMAAGVVIAANSAIAGLLAVVYMVATLTAAVRTEEAFLRAAILVVGPAKPPIQHGARMAQQGIPGRCRPADWVRLPCLAGRGANIIVFCGHADARCRAPGRGSQARAVSSVVEHRLYTPAVAGSKPAPPTNLEVGRSKGKFAL